MESKQLKNGYFYLGGGESIKVSKNLVRTENGWTLPKIDVLKVSKS